MKFYLSEFIRGINDGLSEKRGFENNLFSMTGAIFPTSSSQSKWKFGKSDTHIKLHDGYNVHSFRMPHGEHEEEAFPLIKEPEATLANFHENVTTTGTAQVHKSDPGTIYFTLHDGKKNPTYTFKHENGDQWRAIPKVKNKSKEKTAEIDPDAFIKGAADKLAELGDVLDPILKGTQALADGSVHGLLYLGKDPLHSAQLGLLAGGAYDILKRRLYNTEEENLQESARERVQRYIVPAAAAGLLGSGLHTLFPAYYNLAPVYN